jgi:hypothetical protein
VLECSKVGALHDEMIQRTGTPQPPAPAPNEQGPQRSRTSRDGTAGGRSGDEAKVGCAGCRREAPHRWRGARLPGTPLIFLIVKWILPCQRRSRQTSQPLRRLLAPLRSCSPIRRRRRQSGKLLPRPLRSECLDGASSRGFWCGRSPKKKKGSRHTARAFFLTKNDSQRPRIVRIPTCRSSILDLKDFYLILAERAGFEPAEGY